MLIFNYDEIIDVEPELTTYCNADCPLCYRNYNTFKYHYPINKSRDINELINQLDLFVNMKYIRLVGSISEPTLYNNFFSLIHYLKKRNIEIEICTNGDTNDHNWWNTLGTLLTDKDSVYFTICGSTQELHEIYRKGTNLNNILLNAKAFRSSGNYNDFAQCIRFDYNDDDFNSKEFNDIISEFSNIYWTETFLKKNNDIYVNKENLHKLMPHKENKIKMITADIMSKKFFELNNSETICKAISRKSIQIDINGNIYPCYLFLESSNGKEWNKDWEEIQNLKYEVCRFCQKDIYSYCLMNNIGSIT